SFEQIESDARRLSGHGTPFYRYSLDAVESIFEKVAGADQRETQIVFPFSAESFASNGGDAGFFQEQLLDFSRGKSGVFDIHPGIESAFGRMATETGNFGEGLHEKIAAEFVFDYHRVDGVSRVAKSFN